MSTLFHQKTNKHKTNKPAEVIPRLVSGTILVVGVGIVWVFAFGIGATFLDGLLGSPPSISEKVSLLRDGTPIIVSQENYDEVTTYRTLDGKPLELTDQQDYLFASHLSGRPKIVALLEEPRTWNDRLAAASDYANPRTFWFAIRSPERQGTLYWQGINYSSKETVGFVSKKGFSRVLPQEKDRFLVNAEGTCTTTGYLDYSGHLYVNQKADLSAEPANWIVFQLDTEGIWRIDLRAQTVELFREAPGIISIEMFYEPSWLASQPADEQKEIPDDKAKNTALENRLAMRFADHIDVWNPRTNATVSYPLPSDLQDEGITLMGLGSNQLLVLSRAGYWQQGFIQKLVWLEGGKGESRTELIQLVGYHPPPPRTMAWQMVSVMPIPIAWGFAGLLMHPLNLVNDGRAATYSAAFGQAFQESWPAFTTLLAISAVLAWLAYRRQQILFGSNPKLWALFVFLSGVPGWIAWRIMHPRPPREKCPHCATAVPRNQAICANCAEPFPEPELTGIEVFA